MALTAPINATASPACAASARTDLSVAARNARIVGSNTHGASIIGSVSDEIDPRVVSTRGDSANAAAPITREAGLPIPSASATRSSPQKPTREQQRPPQPLGDPAGHPQQMADQEEGAVRKQVAVGLVLRLAERQLAVPQVGRAGQETQRVGGEVEFGVGGDLPG